MPIPAAGTMFLEEWTPPANSRSKCIVVTTSTEAEENGWSELSVPAYWFFHRPSGLGGVPGPVRESSPLDLDIIDGTPPDYAEVTDDR